MTLGLVRCQGVDDGAGALCCAGVTLTHKRYQRLAHRLEVGEFVLDDLQLARSNLARLATGVSLVKFKEAADLVQG